MDKRGINIELNRLKDKNPGQEAIIEGVQKLFNEKVEKAKREIVLRATFAGDYEEVMELVNDINF